MNNQVSVVCGGCSRTFTISSSSFRANQQRKASTFCCSKQCSGRIKKTTLVLPIDEYSVYRALVKACLQNDRVSGRECNLTSLYLKELWERQEGKCALTGIKLNPYRLGSASRLSHYERDWKNASLDRIDNGLGHVKGNVRFVCFMANLAKSNFKDDELFSFCAALINHSKNKEDGDFSKR